MIVRDAVNTAKNSAIFLLLAIPVSAGIALLYWFFATVVLHVAETPFLAVWRWTYIVIVLVMASSFIIAAIAYQVMVRKYARRFVASRSEVREALIEHRLRKKPDFVKWTPEEFHRNLRLARTIRV